MSQRVLPRHDILIRLSDRPLRFFVSDRFLSDLLKGLDSAGDNVRAVCDTLCDTLSHYTPDLDRIRWELAHTPVAFTFVRNRRARPYGGWEEFVGLKQREGRTFSLEASDCYTPGLPQNIEDYRDGDEIWCLYPPPMLKEIRVLDVPIYPYWSEDNSLVDWIVGSVADGRRKAPRPLISDKGVIFWSFVQENTVPQDSRKAPRKVDVDSRVASDTANVNTADQVYDFIKANAPARSGDIVAMGLVDRRHIFRILRNLQRADRIEKIKHGIYIAK